MKFSLLNSLLILTTIALSLALFIATKKQKLIITDNHRTSCQLPIGIVEDSQWIDKSAPPPLSMDRAYAIGKALANELNSTQSERGISCWHVANISLLSLEEYKADCWVYHLSLEGERATAQVGNTVKKTEDDGEEGMSQIPIYSGTTSTTEYLAIFVLFDGSTHFDAANSSVESKFAKRQIRKNHDPFSD